KSGIIIRIAVANLRVMGRATQGVRLIRLSETDSISSVEKIEQIEGEIEDDIENENGMDIESRDVKTPVVEGAIIDETTDLGALEEAIDEINEVDDDLEDEDLDDDLEDDDLEDDIDDEDIEDDEKL